MSDPQPRSDDLGLAGKVAIVTGGGAPDDGILIGFMEEGIPRSTHLCLTEHLDRTCGGGLSGIGWRSQTVQDLSRRGRCFATS